MSLAVVFILATLLGFASHAPGSLGVFDAAMLVALPQFGREQLLATLLVFRVLYFVIPFTIAISIMGTRELWLNVVLPWKERRRLNGNGNGNYGPSSSAKTTSSKTTSSKTTSSKTASSKTASSKTASSKTAPAPQPTTTPVPAKAVVQPFKRYKSQG
jgi:glycosyltransferase 2 family protein